MKTYIIQWKYKSGTAGPWAKGDEVHLEDGLAEWLNNDSPGVLVEKVAQQAELPFEHVDRMVKQAKRRGAPK